jgi:hypothetical protein
MNTDERALKVFSCIRCFERKVKCDKVKPICTNCVKSKAECIFRTPPPPRRKKKRVQEEVLLARLRHCEELLRSKGVDINTVQSPVHSSPSANLSRTNLNTLGTTPEKRSIQESSPSFAENEPRPGHLIVDHGKSRFIENNLWTSVSDEVNSPVPFTDDTITTVD